VKVINWTPIISIIYWLTVAYVAYAIYQQLDKLGLMKIPRQAYWLIRERIWEKTHHEEH